MSNDKKSSYKTLFGYIAILVVIIVLNALVFPLITQQKIVTTDYGDFIEKIENGEIKAVNFDNNRILFSAMNPDSTETIYQTGNIEDPDLVNRLLDAESPNEGGRVTFTRIIEQESSPILNFLLTWVLPLLLFVALWRYIGRIMQQRMTGSGGNALSLGQSNEKIYAESELKTTFADVAGQDEAKEALSEIVDFLHNPEKYAQIGASLPKGVLLVGPPGTGKTLIARAVAGEAKVPFFAISGSEFVQMFVGMGAAKVRDLFKQAGEKAPCIIFIDEIDTIGKKRDTGFGGNDEREQTLNQLLTEMDGFDGKKGVVLLAATNRPESLDKALLRPGRFDRRVTMELPDLEGRKQILNVHLRKVKHDGDINIDLIARATAGSSGADIANIVNEGALRAVRFGRNKIQTDDLEESVEVVIAGAQKKGKIVSDKEKRIIAYHEIGHAMVAAKQSNSAPVHKITIVPRTSGAMGYTMQIDAEEQNMYTKEELLNRITTLTGGRAAEELFFNSVTTGASNDIEQATKLARAMVTRYGMSEQYDMMALETVNNPYLSADTTLSCSPDTSAEVDREVLKIIRNAHQKAAEMIKENSSKMHELSDFLLEKETINGDQFMEILNRESGDIA